jgi:queuosine precursor transporter
MNDQTLKTQGLRITESQAEWTPKYSDVIAAIFVTTLLVSNLAASKLFQLGPATFTAGILVFPISYIFGDVLTEVYGFNHARRIIYVGFLANLFMSLALWVAIQLPPAPGWNLQKEFEAVHSLIARIVIASIIAYVFGELTNSFVMSRLKIKTSGRHLWLRTISSTIAGQFVDSGFFVLIAFGGVFPSNILITATISAWIFKCLYEAIVTPLTYLVVGKLKRLEGVEHFDRKERLTLFKF